MEALETLSKEQIVAQLENDLKEKSIEDLIASTKHLKSKFEEATEKEEQEQLQAFVAEGGHANDFTPVPNALDGRFKELFNILQEKKKEHKNELARLEEENYKAKLEIIQQLRALTESDNSNIGEAFRKFYELRDAWNNTGAVNQARYKQLQFDYSHLQDVFYYNIGIHKELKNYDFKKNASLKEEIIEKLRNLQNVDSIRQLEHFIKEYQNEWDAIGPTTQEKWEELKNNYWQLVNDIYEKIRLHYVNLREQQKEALEKKQVLIEAAAYLAASISEQSTVKDWNQATEKINALREEWRKSGKLKKSKGDQLFEEFKNHLNVFFEKKSDFFKTVKEENKTAENRKKQLIEKANQLKESTDWATTTPKLIQLQEQWKKTGKASPAADQKLWKQFREACDFFFSAKKQYFDTLDDRLADNLKKKEAAIEAIQQAGNEEQLIAAVQQWHESGFVPKKEIARSNQLFDKALKTSAQKLKIEDTDTLEFEARIRAFKKAENSKDLLNAERKFIQGKIDKIWSEIAQFENNLSFFGPSKGAQKLKEVVEKKIEQANKEISDWQLKLQKIR
jgi:hypothetical protein